jgi:CO2 hydration protein
MTAVDLAPSKHPLAAYIHRLEQGEALLGSSPANVLEVVGILKSYGVVLDAYAINLKYAAEYQYLVFFPFFKFFNGKITLKKLLRHWWHDRINYEYAEYCGRAMMWHGGGGLASYVEGADFRASTERAIAARFRYDPFMQALHRLFPEFLLEQTRLSAYFSALGQFWTIMSAMFLELADRYEAGTIQTIPDVVDLIREALVAAAATPITYQVSWGQESYPIIPPEAGLTFLADTAIPYVEAVFFRGTPFPGTISFNAQAYQIPFEQGEFTYGALYADPLPIGGAGIPPTLLMQDMRHFVPDYLQAIYNQSIRQDQDLRVRICESFQKSMFCVTTAAIQGLAPHPLTTAHPAERQANRLYLEKWMDRFIKSCLEAANE